MLRVTYNSSAGRQRWLFDPDDVDMDEAEEIERAANCTWDEFVAGLVDGRVAARRVVFWHLLRRTNPDYPMPFADTPKLRMGQLLVELGTTEISKMIAQAEASTTIAPRRRDQLLARLYEEFEDAMQAETEIKAGDVTTDPKAETADGTSDEAGAPETPTVRWDQSDESA